MEKCDNLQLFLLRAAEKKRTKTAIAATKKEALLKRIKT